MDKVNSVSNVSVNIGDVIATSIIILLVVLIFVSIIFFIKSRSKNQKKN